jgi:hypothetical protein
MKRAAWKLSGLLLLAAMLPGCLEARETDRMAYDSSRDEFHLVMVLENITGGGPDMQYLNALRRNKDYLIAPCLPGNALGWAPWFLRLDDHKAAKVTFLQPQPGDMQPIEAQASLSSIDIKPGTFFVQDNQLCYYHAITVPGKVIDSLIEQTRKDQLGPLKKAVEKERTRRKNHGTVYTWEQLMQQEVKALQSNSTDHPIKPFMVLEEASLEQLVALTGDVKKGLMREGKDFVLHVPLTRRDRDGLVQLWGVWTKTADTLAAQRKKDKSMLSVRLPAKAVTVTPEDGGVLLALDIVKLYNTFADATAAFRDERSGAPKPAAQETAEVRYARAHEWPLESNLAAVQLLQDFASGTLKSYPSDSLIAPGTYLKVQPKN